MLKALGVAILAFALTGCWVSEKRFFGSDDFVAPPGLEGDFVSENGEGAAEATVVLSREPNGLIKGIATKIAEDEPPQTSFIGFVPIAGGSGKYFLMVDRSEDRKDGGDLYFIGRLTDDDGLEAFWPQCSGTPDITGMTRETAELIGEDVCGFDTRAAVMEAALAAEKVLSGKSMFEFKPLGRLKKSDESDPADGDYDGADGGVDGGGDFTADNAFFER